MPTIHWPDSGASQSYVNVVDGQVRVDDDHEETGQRSTTMDPAAARRLAAAHRSLADALDGAADHISATMRIDHTFAVLERAIAGGDTAMVTAAATNVRALIEEARTGEPATMLPLPEVTEPAPSIT